MPNKWGSWNQESKTILRNGKKGKASRKIKPRKASLKKSMYRGN